MCLEYYAFADYNYNAHIDYYTDYYLTHTCPAAIIPADIGNISSGVAIQFLSRLIQIDIGSHFHLLQVNIQ